jgi:GTP:adenosylcobinamide-phosphate guanylyltransferase
MDGLTSTASQSLEPPVSVRMIVLAGRDRHERDPLAARFGTSHKSLVPLLGRPLVAHVLQTAALHPAVESLAISVEREAFADLFDVLSQLPGRGIVKLVEARENLVDSVLAAAEGWDGALLVTTADHALLTPASIDAMVAALGHADAALALAPRAQVLAAHPGHGNPFHIFADEAYASCNLYAAAGSEALAAAEVFRGGGRFAGNPWQVLRAFGPLALMLMGLRALTLADAMARLSRRWGLRLAAVVLADGSQAIDVDDDATLELAQGLLSQGDDEARRAVKRRDLLRAI